MDIILAVLTLFFVFIVFVTIILVRSYRNSTLWEMIHREEVLWILNLIQNKRLYEFFSINKFKKIGLLGYNDFTFLLAREMEEEGIGIEYIVDDQVCDNLSPIPGIKVISTNALLSDQARIDVLIDMNGHGDIHSYARRCVDSSMRKKIENKIKMEIIDISDLLFFISETLGGNSADYTIVDDRSKEYD